MKALCTKFIAAFAITTTLVTPMVRAEIPFTQASGMLENTQDDKKDFSPFWAMVAVHGKMLESIRFFGNYKSVPIKQTQAVEDDAENIRTVDQGEDNIARLIKELFNSPDGVQFVATTYNNTPVGNLSKNLGEINDIIKILVTGKRSTVSPTSNEMEIIQPTVELPDDAKALIQQINDLKEGENRLLLKKKNIEKEMKENKDKSPKPPKKPVNTENIPEAEWKKHLQEVWTPINEEYQIKLKSIKDKNDKLVGKQKNINVKMGSKAKERKGLEEKLKIIVPSYLLKEKKEIQKDPSTIKKELITAVLNEIMPTLSKENQDFANIVVRAYEDQDKFANPEGNPAGYLYPKNIVVTALLSFFIKVADDRSELEKLPFLMKKEGVVYRPEFDVKYYYEMKDYNRINSGDLNLSSLLKFPEIAFFAAQGYDAYENPYAKPLNYRGDAPFWGVTFPDCGETSLRNVLGIFLSAGNGGLIKPDILNGVMNKLKQLNPELQFHQNTPFHNLHQFFVKNPDMSKGATKEIHGQWAAIVSNLNGGQPPAHWNDVQYGHSTWDNGPKIYEIMSNFHPEVKGIVNMLNVIAKLIPDNVLNELWSLDRTERLTQVSKKLDRLCKLLSQEGLDLSWENEATKDQEILNEFMNIVFMNDESPIFIWQFIDGHFQVDPMATSENDWRVPYQTADERTFQNEWMASLYLILNEDKFIWTENYGTIYPLSLIFNPKIRSVDGAMNALSFVLWKTINDKALNQFESLMTRWIDKSIPLNDPQSLDKISLLIYGVNDFNSVKKILEDQKYSSIQDRVNDLMNQAKSDPDKPLQSAAGEGLNTALIFASRKPNAGQKLYLDYDREGNENSKMITDSTLRELTNLTSLNLANNSKITNEGLKNLKNLTSLDLWDNTNITDEGLKNLENLTSLSLWNNTNITNEGLKNLKNLTSLNLTSNKTITNEGLKNLKNLTSLNLTSNKTITNEGLKNLKNLTGLNLNSNKIITYEGLKDLPNLTTLNLGFNPMISDKDIAKLKKKNPNFKIIEH